MTDRNVFFIHRDTPARAHENGLSGVFAVHRDGRHLQGSMPHVVPQGQEPALPPGASPVSGPHKLSDVVFLTCATRWLPGRDVARQMKEKGFDPESWSAVRQVAQKRGIKVPDKKTKARKAPSQEMTPPKSGVVSVVPRAPRAAVGT